MNKEKSSKKNNLFIIGSARGVKRFYIVNKFIESFPKAKIIHTGNLLQKLIQKMGFENLDKIYIFDYYKYIESIFVEIILSHLEHSDVILDTHYYYLLPGLSIREILKFENRINNTILLLVEETKKEIKESNEGEWYKDLKNIEDDVLLNEYSFENYKRIFKKISKVYDLKVDLNKDFRENMNKLIRRFKNGTD